MSPPQAPQPQQQQIGVGIGHAPTGQAFVALLVSGATIPLSPSDAQALGAQLVGLAAIARLTAEQLRGMATRMETGLVLPGSGLMVQP